MVMIKLVSKPTPDSGLVFAQIRDLLEAFGPHQAARVMQEDHVAGSGCYACIQLCCPGCALLCYQFQVKFRQQLQRAIIATPIDNDDFCIIYLHQTRQDRFQQTGAHFILCRQDDAEHMGGRQDEWLAY